MQIEYELTTDKEVINAADGAILPGVGSAAYAMSELSKYDLCDTLRNYKNHYWEFVWECNCSTNLRRGGDVACLGILPVKSANLITTENLIVPQMGWNNFSKLQECFIT